MSFQTYGGKGQLIICPHVQGRDFNKKQQKHISRQTGNKLSSRCIFLAKYDNLEIYSFASDGQN
jgi:hypothetical protein